MEQREVIQSSRIVIVDGQQPSLALLERILRQGGYSRITGFTDPHKALADFDRLDPDLVALDLHMPHMDGAAFFQQVRSRIREDDFVPILILTRSPAAKREAITLGAKDFLIKSLDPSETLLRFDNLLETRWLHVRLRERTREQGNAQAEILRRLALASGFRDAGQHTQRVGAVAALLGRAIGLPEDHVELLESAAPLHDIGKIGVPGDILLKPGPLTKLEREQVRQHTKIGAKILSGSDFAVLKVAEVIAMYHHEHWDGSGYYHLQGEEIPLEARIVSVADAFDVITHARPYKQEQSLEVALSRIRLARGTQFDPQLVDTLLRIQLRDGLERLSMALQEESVVLPLAPHSVLSEP